MSSSRSGSEVALATPQLALPMVEASQQGEARRAAIGMAEELGFDETGRGEVAIVVTEAATNLVKHARDGLLLLRAVELNTRRGLEILALDKGPGLADIGRAVDDGFSTAGTAGNGLGAIRRLATTFDVHSVPGTGTTVVAVLWADDAHGDRARSVRDDTGGSACDRGVVSLPYPGERVCGDAWAVQDFDGGAMVLVADGLGHGPVAAEAAQAVVVAFVANPERTPAEIVSQAHDAVRHTRGAAVAVARVDGHERKVRYAGIGNISGVIVAPGQQQSMVSHSGTVGHVMRRVQEFTYPWPADALLVMHSDGLSANWQIGRYPGLTHHHPALVAATLYRDASRGRDDATVLAIRDTRGRDTRGSAA